MTFRNVAFWYKYGFYLMMQHRTPQVTVFLRESLIFYDQLQINAVQLHCNSLMGILGPEIKDFCSIFTSLCPRFILCVSLSDDKQSLENLCENL